MLIVAGDGETAETMVIDDPISLLLEKGLIEESRKQSPNIKLVTQNTLKV